MVALCMLRRSSTIIQIYSSRVWLIMVLALFFHIIFRENIVLDIHVQTCVKCYGVLNVPWSIQFCCTITFFNQGKSFVGSSLAKPACYLLVSSLLQIFLQAPLKIHNRVSNRSGLPFRHYLSHWSKWKSRGKSLDTTDCIKNIVSALPLSMAILSLVRI
jgi:hypothetical protein